MSKKIFVYDSFSNKEPILMGLLYVDVVRGNESYSFEYDESWLAASNPALILDPEIMPYRGRQYSQSNKLFGMFADAAPDRWGRMLMNRRERILADAEGRIPTKLQDSDYLLGVYDSTRVGGLRFKETETGPFVSDDKDEPVPPWTTLRTLEEASRRFESDEKIPSGAWLEKLIRPGSSLGGARPKATVADENNELWIAKFPSKQDDNDTGAWEKVTSDLARMCGLNVPESRLEKFSDRGSTFLVRRFDRTGKRRIHFSSSMNLLGKADGDSAANGVSYLDIASFIKASGAAPKEDLEELWKRIVFSIAVNNNDDHLRNHGFILDKKGWRLSPMYDVNPVPYGDELALNIDDINNKASFELAAAVAPRFGVTTNKATEYIRETSLTVQNNYRKLAKNYGLSNAQIEAMRPAFMKYTIIM